MIGFSSINKSLIVIFWIFHKSIFVHMKMVVLLDNRHGGSNNIEQEIWKDIPGWEGLYQVSNLGQVKSLARDYVICNIAIVHKKEKILKQHTIKFWYKHVELNYKGKAKNYPVHRLVALAFIPNPENKPYIDHIDTNTGNNKVENLRWVTAVENAKNPLTSQKRKQIKYYSGELNPLFEDKSPDSKPVLQFDKQGNLIAKYSCCHQAMRKNPGFSFSSIARACRGERYTYKNFIWKYDCIA